MKNPIKDKKRSYRVVRSGNWYNQPSSTWASYRGNYAPTAHYNFIGFRILRNA